MPSSLLGLGGRHGAPPMSAPPGGALRAVAKRRPAQGPRSKKTTNLVTMTKGYLGSFLCRRPGSPLQMGRGGIWG